MNGKDILNVTDELQHLIIRSRSMETLLESCGLFGLQHFRNGKLIGEHSFPNGVTDVGKQYMLNAAFNDGDKQTVWSIGLIDGSTGTPTVSNLDAMSVHNGWSEFVTYTETVRPYWVRGAAASNQVAGTSAATYTIGSVPANSFVAGGFVVSNNTKGGTAGVLWATGLYTSPVPVQPTDVFKLGYLTGL